MDTQMIYRSGRENFYPTSVAPLDNTREVRRLAPMLQRLYDLTPTESEVAARIAFGERVKGIARVRRSSTATVRTHLHRIFDKTGATHQAALVMLVMLATEARACRQHGG